MPDSTKCRETILIIRNKRGTLRFGCGNKRLRYQLANGTRGNVADITCYACYDDAPFKLRRKKGNLVLECLPIREPRAYKILLVAGKVFALSNKTYSARRIKKHLADRFDCPISVMTRNINWQAIYRGWEPPRGYFELLAYLDGNQDAAFAEAFPNVDEIDTRLFNWLDEFKAELVPRLEAIEGQMERLEENVEELTQRMDQMEEQAEEDRAEVHNLKENVGDLNRRADKTEKLVEEDRAMIGNLEKRVEEGLANLEERLVERAEEGLAKIGNLENRAAADRVMMYNLESENKELARKYESLVTKVDALALSNNNNSDQSALDFSLSDESALDYSSVDSGGVLEERRTQTHTLALAPFVETVLSDTPSEEAGDEESCEDNNFREDDSDNVESLCRLFRQCTI